MYVLNDSIERVCPVIGLPYSFNLMYFFKRMYHLAVQHAQLTLLFSSFFYFFSRVFVCFVNGSLVFVPLLLLFLNLKLLAELGFNKWNSTQFCVVFISILSFLRYQAPRTAHRTPTNHRRIIVSFVLILFRRRQFSQVFFSHFFCSLVVFIIFFSVRLFSVVAMVFLFTFLFFFCTRFCQ